MIDTERPTTPFAATSEERLSLEVRQGFIRLHKAGQHALRFVRLHLLTTDARVMIAQLYSAIMTRMLFDGAIKTWKESQCINASTRQSLLVL